MGSRSSRKFRSWVAALAISVSLGACASSTENGPVVDDNDPLEPVNRFTFALNGAVDAVLLYPAASWYRDIAPDEVKQGTRNFVNNRSSPLTFLHDLAQLEGEKAFIIAQRFLINSTVGIGGLFDVATELGVEEHHEEDAGKTMARYGMPEGPYLVLPLFGPSNFRDASGTAIDYVIDPVRWVPRSLGEKEIGTAISTASGTANAVDTRASLIDTLDEVQRTSLDYYAAIRSLYRQRRADEINNGAPKPMTGGVDGGYEDPEDASFDFDDPIESAETE